MDTNQGANAQATGTRRRSLSASSTNSAAVAARHVLSDITGFVVNANRGNNQQTPAVQQPPQPAQTPHQHDPQRDHGHNQPHQGRHAPLLHNNESNSERFGTDVEIRDPFNDLSISPFVSNVRQSLIHVDDNASNGFDVVGAFNQDSRNSNFDFLGRNSGRFQSQDDQADHEVNALFTSPPRRSQLNSEQHPPPLKRRYSQRNSQSFRYQTPERDHSWMSTTMNHLSRPPLTEAERARYREARANLLEFFDRVDMNPHPNQPRQNCFDFRSANDRGQRQDHNQHRDRNDFHTRGFQGRQDSDLSHDPGPLGPTSSRSLNAQSADAVNTSTSTEPSSVRSLVKEHLDYFVLYDDPVVPNQKVDMQSVQKSISSRAKTSSDVLKLSLQMATLMKLNHEQFVTILTLTLPMEACQWIHTRSHMPLDTYWSSLVNIFAVRREKTLYNLYKSTFTKNDTVVNMYYKAKASICEADPNSMPHAWVKHLSNYLSSDMAAWLFKAYDKNVIEHLDFNETKFVQRLRTKYPEFKYSDPVRFSESNMIDYEINSVGREDRRRELKDRRKSQRDSSHERNRPSTPYQPRSDTPDRGRKRHSSNTSNHSYRSDRSKSRDRDWYLKHRGIPRTQSTEFLHKEYDRYERHKPNSSYSGSNRYGRQNSNSKVKTIVLGEGPQKVITECDNGKRNG